MFKKITIAAVMLFAAIFMMNTSFAASKNDESANITAKHVLVWSNEAAVAAYSYNFAQIDKNLKEASLYFTKSAWNDFYQSLVNSGQLNKVKDEKLVVSAVAYGSPVIIGQSVFNKMPAWQVQVPLLVTYQSAYQQTQEKIIANMVVVQSSKKNAIDGFVVAQFTVKNQEQS